jgi:hypothetical protein
MAKIDWNAEQFQWPFRTRTLFDFAPSDYNAFDNSLVGQRGVEGNTRQAGNVAGARLLTANDGVSFSCSKYECYSQT